MMLAVFTTDLDGIATVLVSAVVLVCWLDNLWRSLGLWKRYRDGRSFRAFLIAILLALAAVTYFTGAVAVYVQPELLEPVRALGLVIRGAFLVVGIFTFISWRVRRG